MSALTVATKDLRESSLLSGGMPSGGMASRPIIRGRIVTPKGASVVDLFRAGLAPRGLSREQAAAYVGISVGTFDAMTQDGRMPRPKQINARKVWDRHQLDRSFAALPDDSGAVDSDDVWSAAAV